MWKERMRREGGGSFFFQTKKGFLRFEVRFTAVCAYVMSELKTPCFLGRLILNALWELGEWRGMAAAQRMCVFLRSGCVCIRGPVWGTGAFNSLFDFTESSNTKKCKFDECTRPKQGLKSVWPKFRTMCYLPQIYTDMIGLVVIITSEHLVLFSLNHCNGKQEPFQRTVGAILLLDSVSVSLWLLDNSIFGKAGGKKCDGNSP